MRHLSYHRQPKLTPRESEEFINCLWFSSRGTCRLRVVSNFGDCDCEAGKIHTRARESSPRNFARARVYFARPTIAIAKIRDYSQSTGRDLRERPVLGYKRPLTI